MAERRTRRRLTPEFKAQTVKRVLDGRSLSEVATELGLSIGQLSTWRTEHLATGSAEALAQREVCTTNGRFCYIRYRDEIIRHHLGFFAWTEAAHQHDSPPHASPGRRQRWWMSGSG